MVIRTKNKGNKINYNFLKLLNLLQMTGSSKFNVYTRDRELTIKNMVRDNRSGQMALNMMECGKTI